MLVAALASMVLVGAAASAPAQSAIAGVVRDSSGAVLPGVTVEVTSPALIEKTRAAVTDQAGQYKVIDLRPGVYSVTFQLQGFATITRTGVTLLVGQTATLDLQMAPSTVQE